MPTQKSSINKILHLPILMVRSLTIRRYEKTTIRKTNIMANDDNARSICIVWYNCIHTDC